MRAHVVKACLESRRRCSDSADSPATALRTGTLRVRKAWKWEFDLYDVASIKAPARECVRLPPRVAGLVPDMRCSSSPRAGRTRRLRG